jgi:hypothetical protein
MPYLAIMRNISLPVAVSSITAASGTTLAGRSSAPTLRRKASYSSESSLLFRRLTSISLSAARREFATGHSVSLD